MKLKEITARLWFPLALASLGQVIWGFSVLFSKVALQMAPPNVLLSIRFLLAALIMTLMVLSGRVKVSLRGKNVKPLLLLAITEPCYFFCESYGILYTNATFAGVVLAVAPVAAIVLAIVFLREYPSVRQACFCLLPVAGVIMMTVSGNSLGIIQPIGVAFLMGACLSSACNKTANRKSSEEYTFFERTYFVILFSAVIFTISAVFTTGGDFSAYLKPLAEPKFLFSVLMLSVFCSVICNLLVNYAVAKMPVVKLSSLGALSTLCSMFAGALFLGEPLTLGLVTGAALILVGIWQVSKG